MASLHHQLSLVFLLFLASSSFQIHARESRFFMKTTRPEDPKEATPIPEETPAVKMEDPSTLPPLQSLSGSGYGLYRHGQEQFTPATTTDNNNNNYYYNNARPNTELTRRFEGHGQEQFTPATTTDNNNNYYYNNARPNTELNRRIGGPPQEQFTPATTTDNNNNYYYNNARPNTELSGENYENKYNGGYNYANQFKYAYNGPSKFSNEEFNGGNHETKGYSNYVDPNKQYGMSDTRFLDNGRYFYDVNAGRNRNQYETYPTRGNSEAGAIGGYQNNQVNQVSREDYVP
ncbi:protein E6-like [Phoenix dactylifera]|uniref:Protein E6-like n=1 Tax=Phoenix dactylifera TaxID=42345 RepID=A0A8B7CG86_PHODC|nr:protein E6-like [Phoenix dactylifera]